MESKKIKIQYPNFKNIVAHCKYLIDRSFPRYHNSWTTIQDKSFWQARLQQEVKEAMEETDPLKLKYEIIDIINVASMWYEQTKEDWEKKE